ncbi:MAG: hypothetical protein KAQ96_09855 [Thermoplasmata archaeon]|nr:hypothetical protein [Thermoplasmata archaeon]
MLSVVLSFILTAVWVTIATVVTERMGTKVGAVVTTLPSSAVVAFYFFAVEQGPEFAAQAAVVVPAEMGINVVFLGVFVAMSRRGLPTALVAALGGWTIMSAILYLADIGILFVSWAVFLALIACTTVWLRSSHRFYQMPGKHIHYTVGELAFRGLFAGLMISLSVVGAAMGGPVVAGILSVFPAIFTSTMVILYLRQGREFTGAVGTVMVVSSTNVVVYTTVIHFAYPEVGLGWGTSVALAISYAWSLGMFLAVRRWMD